MDARRSGSVGEALEQALRAYETALIEKGLAGRHVRPDEEPAHLRELRREVFRQAEALPSACWPRTRCGHCRGRREVTTMHAQYGTSTSPEFTVGRRLCPRCWGTGLVLDLHRPEPTTPLRMPRPALTKPLNLPPDWQRRKRIEGM